MNRIVSFGNEGPKPMPPAWLGTLVRLIPIILLALVLVCAWALSAWAGAVAIPRDRVCTALGEGEGCQWQVVRTLAFRVTVIVNDEGQSAWALTRGSKTLGSGPLPAEFGTVEESDLLKGLLLINIVRYAQGDAATRDRILQLAHLESGVPYLADLRNIRVADGTGDALGTVLTGNARIAIAQ